MELRKVADDADKYMDDAGDYFEQGITGVLIVVLVVGIVAACCGSIAGATKAGKKWPCCTSSWLCLMALVRRAPRLVANTGAGEV